MQRFRPKAHCWTCGLVMALLTTTGAAADRNSVYPGQSWDQSEQARGPLSPPGSLCLKPGPWRYDEMYETKTIGFHPHGSLLRSHSGGNLACASVEEGGMFDGWGRRVFRFPADGHPDMCVAVVDLTGDCRDEMVVWDPNEVWIYTQNDNPKSGRLYKPKRNSLSNYSNYQATISLPGWSNQQPQANHR